MAMEFDDNISGKVVAQCNDEGLLLNPVKPNAIRFMPPLNITPAEIDPASGEAGSRAEVGLSLAGRTSDHR